MLLNNKTQKRRNKDMRIAKQTSKINNNIYHDRALIIPAITKRHRKRRPIPNARESNKHRMWQRRTVEATHKLYSGGQHYIDHPERCIERKGCRGREQGGERELKDGRTYVNTARYVTREEPVAKHHIPIPSARESNKHRVWQRITVEATHILYSGGQHCIDQPERCKGSKGVEGGAGR